MQSWLSGRGKANVMERRQKMGMAWDLPKYILFLINLAVWIPPLCVQHELPRRAAMQSWASRFHSTWCGNFPASEIQPAREQQSGASLGSGLGRQSDPWYGPSLIQCGLRLHAASAALPILTVNWLLLVMSLLCLWHQGEDYYEHITAAALPWARLNPWLKVALPLTKSCNTLIQGFPLPFHWHQYSQWHNAFNCISGERGEEKRETTKPVLLNRFHPTKEVANCWLTAPAWCQRQGHERSFHFVRKEVQGFTLAWKVLCTYNYKPKRVKDS